MKFKMFTLGCKVNAYESDALKELFLKKGFQEGIDCSNDWQPQRATDSTRGKTGHHQLLQVPHGLP